ncbi:hypothetical protein [Streptomyces radiopugnans]|uniref:hypothetical protein n=1 Tax=Streptomyces radiopugnans TaxID=403935 RepID=UPI003F1A53E1
MPADLWGPDRDPVHRVLGVALDAAGIGRSGRHPVEVRGRDRLKLPPDLAQVDAAVITQESAVVPVIEEKLIKDIVRPAQRCQYRVGSETVIAEATTFTAAGHQRAEVA